MNIIFLGISGSGKSTGCDYLQNCGYVNYHPIRFLKSQLEEHYDLEAGSLDTVEGKNYVPKGANSTMQKIMVELFHFWELHDPQFTSRKMINYLNLYWGEADTQIVFQAIRKYNEAKTIRSKAEVFAKNYRIILLTGRGKSETSDHQMLVVQQTLECSDAWKGTYTYDNSKNNLVDFYKFIERVRHETN